MCNENPGKISVKPILFWPKTKLCSPKGSLQFRRQEKKIDINSFGLITIDAR